MRGDELDLLEQMGEGRRNRVFRYGPYLALFDESDVWGGGDGPADDRDRTLTELNRPHPPKEPES